MELIIGTNAILNSLYAVKDKAKLLGVKLDTSYGDNFLYSDEIDGVFGTINLHNYNLG